MSDGIVLVAIAGCDEYSDRTEWPLAFAEVKDADAFQAWCDAVVAGNITVPTSRSNGTPDGRRLEDVKIHQVGRVSFGHHFTAPVKP